MAEFKKNNRFSGGGSKGFRGSTGGRPSFGGKPGGRDFGGPKQMHEAECNSCHKVCQVPFRPNGMKPVYCSDCFKQEDDRAPRPRFEKRGFDAPRSFGPPAPRPPEDRRIDDIKRQLDSMTATLERLVTVLETSNRASALTKEVSRITAAPEKPAKKVSTKKVAKKKTAKKKA